MTGLRRLLFVGACSACLLCARDTPRPWSWAGGRPMFLFAVTPGPVPSPELDPQRERFRLHVEPYRVLGTGRLGRGSEDIDEPDGLAFDRRGLLLATDAQNQRIQIWNVRSGRQVGRFGSAATFVPGELVDLAVAPDGTVVITDEKANRAYAFALRGEDYVLTNDNLLANETYKRLGGIAIDENSNIYTVDAELNEVRKYRSNGIRDPVWKFEQNRTEQETFLKNAEGIALDDSRGILYVASEFDYVIHLFDSKTGGSLKKLIGARLDVGNNALTGKRVFTGSWAVYSGSPEGLSQMHGYLFAVDEFAGHVHIFDTRNENLYNRDLDDLSRIEGAAPRSSGYIGFVGHTPLLNVENPNYRKRIRMHQLNPADYNPPGYLCSPDSVATYFDEQIGEGYIAVADQCNYRIIVYRWSEIVQAAGLTRR